MNTRVIKITSLLSFVFFAVSSSFAQQLVYKPINPAFGGDTFNYQWLLSSAQAQNTKEDKSSAFGSLNPLDDFENNLNRQILNQLGRKLLDDIFGEEGLKDGSFEYGNLQIDITSGLDGVTVDIVNTRDGNRTNLLIPYY
jgi:curli production assembly/transport component CsgF